MNPISYPAIYQVSQATLRKRLAVIRDDASHQIEANSIRRELSRRVGGCAQ